jgi:hypothetical protein
MWLDLIEEKKNGAHMRSIRTIWKNNLGVFCFIFYERRTNYPEIALKYIESIKPI